MKKIVPTIAAAMIVSFVTPAAFAQIVYPPKRPDCVIINGTRICQV